MAGMDGHPLSHLLSDPFGDGLAPWRSWRSPRAARVRSTQCGRIGLDRLAAGREGFLPKLTRRRAKLLGMVIAALLIYWLVRLWGWLTLGWPQPA